MNSQERRVARRRQQRNAARAERAINLQASRHDVPHHGRGKSSALKRNTSSLWSRPAELPFSLKVTTHDARWSL